jgi:hypothetical protein
VFSQITAGLPWLALKPVQEMINPKKEGRCVGFLIEGKFNNAQESSKSTKQELQRKTRVNLDLSYPI